MATIPQGNFEEVAPPASALVESLRDIGYSLATAVSDIIDNSIAAEATHVEWFADPYDEEPFIGFLDDGTGMSKKELREAMRLGGTRSVEAREGYDLGRFGLGLKTASFSQCRKLTVLTRKEGITSCARWNLDLIEKTGKWTLEFLTDFSEVPWAEKLIQDGTLVIWQALDRLIEDDYGSDGSFIRKLDEAADYVELVFHRFLAGELGLKKLYITFNNRGLEPLDPFNSKHSATIIGQEEIFQLAEQRILIQQFTLPHHKKVTPDEWEKYAIKDGYVKNQGFYIYRQKRLIIYGTWFNLARQDEITKLSRVRIDMPTGLDLYWKIDIKKASAQLPEALRKHLKILTETMVDSSKRVYINKGSPEATKEQLPVWIRNRKGDRITYLVDESHPLIKDFLISISEDKTKKFFKLLKLISASIPVDALFADIASNPISAINEDYDAEALSEVLELLYKSLSEDGMEYDYISKAVLSSEPFKSHSDITRQILSEISQRVS